MAEHTVQVRVPSSLGLTKSDVKFDVSADGEKFGTLTVSKGGIGWWPRDAKAERHLTWELFDIVVRREWGE